MSAEATLRPLLAKYIREEDSLNTAFAEPTTDLFSLGLIPWGPLPCSMISPLRGIAVEFTELVENPTVEFLTSRIS